MKSPLVLCVFLAAILSIRAASLPPTVEAVTATVALTTTPTPPSPTTTQFTVTTTPTPTTVVTGLYGGTTPPTTPSPTTPTPTTTQFTVTTTPNTNVTGPLLQPGMLSQTSPYATSVPPVTSCRTQPPLTTNMPAARPPQSQVMCPDGWKLFQGRCYLFLTGAYTWPQALSSCAMHDSMLVSIHSPQEYNFLQLLSRQDGIQNAWLGGFYLQDQWLWIDGSWFYNNSWSIQFPPSSNRCLVLNNYEEWSDSPCDTPGYSSVCVKNSNVPPATLCPGGWTSFQGRCYYYNQEPMTWPEADARCADLQASLVSVHTPTLYSFLYQQTTVYGFSPAWVGGFYFDDQWLWLDGSWFYQGFFTAMSADSGSPCLATFMADGWSNYDCDQNLFSFCVRDPQNK